MARVKRSVNGKKSRRATLEQAKGYTGSRSRHLRAANEQVMHSLRYALPATGARRARASSAGSGSCASTPRAVETTSRTRGSCGLKAAEVEVDRKGPRRHRGREPATFGALVSNRTRGARRRLNGGVSQA